jgi:hypothetical protein
MNGRTPLTVFEEGLALVPAETENTEQEFQTTAV